ncbi:ATP-binding cassette domain-containing protein [Microbacterium sp. E-13]|uniref:ATP-binding cassette domain-containing protein n=1 Tax=Microbacterium sp. E-13 TaxID=3404048 RepID=UPI003CF887CC
MEQLTKTVSGGLRVHGLGKASRGLVILDDVSLELPWGSFYMLLGENGAGKTTLFRCLLGLTRHTGLVEVAGAGGSATRTGFAAVLDQGSLYRGWSVRANIDYQLNDSAGHRHPEVRAMVPDRMLGVRAGRLSTGQRKLVMLAAALASDARVLLLDEFSNGLDQQHRALMRQRLVHATRDGGRIIVATGHDLETFEGLPTSVGGLVDGRLRELDAVYARTGSLRETYAVSVG